MMDNIMIMDETMVSYHTPRTKKKHSKQWIKKGQPGPIKARAHSGLTKHLLLAKGLSTPTLCPGAP